MLNFILKKNWYEKIKSGEKTIEYREVKDYWRQRLKKEVARMEKEKQYPIMEIGEEKKMNETQLVYVKMRTEIENLKNENEWNKKELELLRGNAKKIITHFWMWYVSGNHKRDFNKKEEGEKYANSFLNDLVKEVSGIE